MKAKLTLVALSLFMATTALAQNDPTPLASHPAFNAAAVIDLTSNELLSSDKRKQYYDDESWKKLMDQKYLTPAYAPCYIDDYKQLAFVRFNIVDNQMEFLKDDETFYLLKERGKTVTFTQLNSTYKVFEYDGSLDFYQVKKEGKNSLLKRQIKKFIKPKEAKTHYDSYQPAFFKDFGDKYYIAFENKGVVEIPKKKKKFYELLGNIDGGLKQFAKKNNLKPKDVKDLEKLVEYANKSI